MAAGSKVEPAQLHVAEYGRTKAQVLGEPGFVAPALRDGAALGHCVVAGDTVLGAVADAGLALGDFGGDPAQREHVKHLLGAVERGLPAFGATSTGRAIAGDGFHIGAARADAPLLQIAAVPAEVHRVDIRAGALNIEGVTGGELVEGAGEPALVLAGVEFVFAGGDVSAPQADLEVHHIVQEGEVR